MPSIAAIFCGSSASAAIPLVSRLADREAEH
jgi:hypothetical protein